MLQKIPEPENKNKEQRKNILKNKRHPPKKKKPPRILYLSPASHKKFFSSITNYINHHSWNVTFFIFMKRKHFFISRYDFVTFFVSTGIYF